jgi:hypothetical protein
MANYKKMVFNSENPNGIEMDFTAEEKTEYDNFAEATKDYGANNIAKHEKRATDQASGNQKFLDMGLTQAEATALTGYVPPKESE